MAYWRAMQQTDKEQTTWEAALHDKQLKQGSQAGMECSQEVAESYIHDPLRDFPNDVDYSLFTDEVVQRKLMVYRKFVTEKRREPTLQEERQVWTPQREKALTGSDPVARRASVNGELWYLYRALSQRQEVTLDMLRTILRRDFAVAKLIPVIPFEPPKDLHVPPGSILIPSSHIEALCQTGSWHRLLDEARQYGGLHLPLELGSP